MRVVSNMKKQYWLLFALLIGGWTAGLPVAGAGDAGAPNDPLVVGVFPRRDPEITIRLFTPLAQYLQQQLARTVRLETAPDFKVFQQRLATRHYDLVHFNQYHYIKAHAAYGYDVLARNEEFGEAVIRGAIYVRRDSGIRRIEDLRGKRVLFGGGKDAMMSYLVPRYLLLNGGLKRGDYQELFAVTPPNAVLATYLGLADAGCAGEVVRRLPIVKERIDVNQLRMIAVSDPLPHLPWAVKKDMSSELRNRLRKLLLALKDSEHGRAVLDKAHLTGFQPAVDADYDVHRMIVERVENDD